MSTASFSWLLWRDGTNSPAYNMAADEALLLTATQPLLRLYRWDRPAQSIGFFQNYQDTLSAEAVSVRRMTGGGVVDHTNSYTYTVFLPPNHPWATGDRLACYQSINALIDQAIQTINPVVESKLTEEEIEADVNRRTMRCAAHPTKFDIVNATGKISGCAQRRTNEGVLHQGYIDRSVGSWEALQQAIIDVFETDQQMTFKDFEKSTQFVETVEELVKSRYGHKNWNEKR